MQVFTTPEGKFKSTADKYKKTGEKARISMPIEFEGKRYREVVYNKSILGKMKRNIEGIIFLSEDGEYVSNSRVKNELAKLGYQYEIMLDDKSIGELKKAVTPELEIEKLSADYGQIIKAIERMNSAGIKGIDNVISILQKIPLHKRENNNVIEAYLNHVENISRDDFVFSSEVYDKLYPYYKEILIKNFQRVRLVASGRGFYDDIKREGQKRKRNLTARFNSHEVFMGLTKLPVEMDHLKSIVTVYDSVSSMKQEEYLKYLKTIERSNITSRIQLLR